MNKTSYLFFNSLVILALYQLPSTENLATQSKPFLNGGINLLASIAVNDPRLFSIYPNNLSVGS